MTGSISLILSKPSYCLETRDRQSTQKNSSVTNHSFAYWAERKPRVRLAVYTALLDRLAVLNRHLIVWIGWAPSFPSIWEKITDCRSFSDLKIVTGSRPKKILSVTNHGFALWAERKPIVRLAVYTALLDRLAVLNRHLIVWTGWAPSFP